MIPHNRKFLKKFSRNFATNTKQHRVQLPTKSQREKYLENPVEVEQ